MEIPNLWQRLIDTLLPLSPESRIIRRETPTSFCKNYLPRRRDKTLILSRYQEPAVQAAINANKFQGDRHASALLALLLENYMDHKQSHIDSLQIIPIPLSATRKKERGYNQVSLVLKALSHYPQHDIMIVNALKRTLHTKPQSKLKRQQRLKNVKGAFVSTRQATHLDVNKPIWILDDVATTGATLHAAKQALPLHIQRSKTLELVALAG